MSMSYLPDTTPQFSDFTHWPVITKFPRYYIRARSFINISRVACQISKWYERLMHKPMAHLLHAFKFIILPKKDTLYLWKIWWCRKQHRHAHIKSIACERFVWISKWLSSMLILMINCFVKFASEVCRWSLFIDESTFVQVLAWCRQATNHYLTECRHRFMSPYHITRLHYVSISAYVCFCVNYKCTPHTLYGTCFP